MNEHKYVVTSAGGMQYGKSVRYNIMLSQGIMQMKEGQTIAVCSLDKDVVLKVVKIIEKTNEVKDEQ